MKIEGHFVTRPTQDHPDPEHWAMLRFMVGTMIQGNKCGTCWRSGGDYVLELHHRHYNNFGKEKPEDVVMLCNACHMAITSRIRDERFARGDKTIEPVTVESVELHRPIISAVVEVNVTTEGIKKRFRQTI